MPIKFTGPRVERFGEGWMRGCELNGVHYRVFVTRGKAVCIPYKPRGKNLGFKWHGEVFRDGERIFSDSVDKSIGVRGLLIMAGVYG
jgi:hypothetical protein